MMRVIHDLGDFPTQEWRKATASNPSGNCVEMAQTSDRILIRHSHAPEGPALVFNSDEWTAFLDGVKKGEFEIDWERV